MQQTEQNFVIVPSLHDSKEFYVIRDNGIEIKVTRQRNRVSFSSSIYNLSAKEKQAIKELINLK